jgi:hypothetical protein
MRVPSTSITAKREGDVREFVEIVAREMRGL